MVKGALGSNDRTPNGGNPLGLAIPAINRSRRIRQAIGLVGSGKMAWKRQRTTYIDRKDAMKEKKIYDRSPNMKARIVKVGNGKSRIKIGNKTYSGTRSKNGKFTLNTYAIEYDDIPMATQRRSKAQKRRTKSKRY